MNYLETNTRFNSLSLTDLLRARDQFHVHLMHKPNVAGTAIGRYLIRKTDPMPPAEPPKRGKKEPRTLENSEVRDYSWPCVLVFVSEWVDEKNFGMNSELPASGYIPRTIYLEDGRSAPICVVLASPVESAPPPLSDSDLIFPKSQLAGGYPVIAEVQGSRHIASIGCLVTDGHRIYALTNRHVAGNEGETLFSIVGKQKVKIGRASGKQLGKVPFEKVYGGWPGKNVFVNLDVALIDIDDDKKWSPAIFGLGPIGPLADLSTHNIGLQLIGCPVRAFGCASKLLEGSIAALFYRYKAVGGFEYVADFLIGSRDETPLRTAPGDSSTIWTMESDDVNRGLMPIAIQWGGAVFSGESADLPFALATNLSTVCRELDVDLFRSRKLAKFEYWGVLGHYTIGALACAQVGDAKLKSLMMANRDRVSFDPDDLDGDLDKVKAPGFVPLADVPDKVWKLFKSATAPYGRRGKENPNHYADIDFSMNGIKSLDAQTPNAAALKADTWINYYRSVGWNQVSERGLLPFRIWQIYKEMVRFVIERDVASFVAAAGVLAHYVGDACQPLHGSMYDDGDPFRNPDGTPSPVKLGHGQGFAHGVHSAYEGTMLDQNVDTLLKDLPGKLGVKHGMELVRGGQQAGYAGLELMRRAQKAIKPIDVVNAYGAIPAQERSKKGPTILWQRFNKKTLTVLADGCRTLAMLWESAWIEGDGKKVVQSEVKGVSQVKLRKIYESQDFVPSVALGQIHQHL